MTEIPGERRAEVRRAFHGPDGRHLYPHPATYESRRSRWSGAERAYAAHLDRHRELAENPEPMPGDSKTVTALFAHIETLRAIIEKEQQLIIAVRQKEAQGAEGDDLEDVRRTLRQGGVDV